MKNMSFLLVDDNEIALRELANILKYLSYTDIRTSTSAEQAWKLMKVDPADCIIAAWNMPEMSGLALLKIARQDDYFYKVPFFLTDAAFTKIKVVQAGQSGVSGLLVKPFDMNNLKSKVAALSEFVEESTAVEGEEQLEKGLELIESGDYRKALKVFEKLTEEGETAEYYYNIGYIKTAQKLYNDAISAFRMATKLDRLFAKAFEAMGRVYKEMGDPETAARYLQKAADIYISKENVEDAESILNEILETSVDSVNVYNSLGVLYRKKGDLDTALKNYEKALKVHPDESHIYYNIGRIYVDMKKSSTAKKYFSEAIKIDPDFTDARDVLHAIEVGVI